MEWSDYIESKNEIRVLIKNKRGKAPTADYLRAFRDIFIANINVGKHWNVSTKPIPSLKGTNTEAMIGFRFKSVAQRSLTFSVSASGGKRKIRQMKTYFY